MCSIHSITEKFELYKLELKTAVIHVVFTSVSTFDHDCIHGEEVWHSSRGRFKVPRTHPHPTTLNDQIVHQM